MDLRTLDLNLLLIFDAVYAERSISKAARKLNLSQPTVSNSIRRLRERLADPLFTPASNGVIPTARATSLAEPIRQALDLLQTGIRGHRDEFDHLHSRRTFVIAVEDYGEAVVLPGFFDWLSKVAPDIRLHIRREPGGELTNELREGSVDLSIDYFAPRTPGFHSECVVTDTLVTLSRSDHPQLDDKLTLEAYLALKHVVLTPRAGTIAMIELALAKRGLRRSIAVEVPHFLSMPLLIQASDTLCTLPRRMADLYANRFRLKMHKLPLRIPEFPIFLIWHSSSDADPAHAWFRRHLMKFCSEL
jgi:DNA-binding transcriptional LysR family regulator